MTFHDSSKQLYSYRAGTNGIGRLTGIDEQNPSLVTELSTAYTYGANGRASHRHPNGERGGLLLGYRLGGS